MLLSIEQKEQFMTDWKELTISEMQHKYSMSEVEVYQKAKNIGLPKRGKGWWPQSKIIRFMMIYKKTQRSTLMAEFECSESTILSKAKQFGLCAN